MANALDVISLEEAKEYLVVDFDDRDNEIISAIETAVDFIETYTNIMLYQRSKIYTLIGSCLEIYDYPIDMSLSVRRRQNVLSVTVFGSPGDEISTLVGYVSKDDIPNQLLTACKKLILYIFENKDIYSDGLPWDVQVIVNKLRRSATII